MDISKDFAKKRDLSEQSNKATLGRKFGKQ